MPGELQGTRVAVVDDDALLRESLGVYLTVKGCRVETFASAEEVFGAGDLGRFGVVICGLHFPGERRLSLFRRVRQASAAVITILITSASATVLAGEGGASVIDGVVVKPFQAEELVGLLLRLQGRRHLVEKTVGGATT